MVVQKNFAYHKKIQIFSAIRYSGAIANIVSDYFNRGKRKSTAPKVVEFKIQASHTSLKFSHVVKKTIFNKRRCARKQSTQKKLGMKISKSALHLYQKIKKTSETTHVEEHSKTFREKEKKSKIHFLGFGKNIILIKTKNLKMNM